MFISHKSNILQKVHEIEWQCRRMTKGITKDEYWIWLDSVTTVTGTAPDTETTVDYSGETGYTIVECRDEDVEARLAQLLSAVGVPGVQELFFDMQTHPCPQIFSKACVVFNCIVVNLV